MPAAQVAVLPRLRLPRCAAASPSAPLLRPRRCSGTSALALALLPAGSGPICVAGGARRGQPGRAAAPAAMASRKQRANVLIDRQIRAPAAKYWPDEPAPIGGYFPGTIVEYKPSTSRTCCAPSRTPLPHRNPKCRNGARWGVAYDDDPSTIVY